MANNLEKALELIKADHIQQNKFRLGLIGSQDIDSIQYYLELELKQWMDLKKADPKGLADPKKES